MPSVAGVFHASSIGSTFSDFSLTSTRSRLAFRVREDLYGLRDDRSSSHPPATSNAPAQSSDTKRAMGLLQTSGERDEG